MPLTDTHCHLNLSEYFPNPDEAVARAHAAGVADLIVVGLDPATSRAALDLAERHPNVWAVVGRHPNYAADYDPSELQEIRALLGHPKAVALGEVGLDEHWDYATPQQQEKCLRDQLPLAYDLGKPVVFHCRDAYPRLLDLLAGEPRHPIALHCFAGDAQDAARALELDCRFGIDGPITYKKNGIFRDLVATIPRERLLIETDSPFLSPEPFRGKPNEPAQLPWVNRGLAAAIGLSEGECGSITTATARSFFRL